MKKEYNKYHTNIHIYTNGFNRFWYTRLLSNI